MERKYLNSDMRQTDAPRTPAASDTSPVMSERHAPPQNRRHQRPAYVPDPALLAAVTAEFARIGHPVVASVVRAAVGWDAPSFYPILDHLTAHGVLVSDWQAAPRPGRYLYSLAPATPGDAR